MKSMLIVGFGGCIGAIIRYKLSGLVMHHTEGWKFPAGTFAVNVIGCLIAGVMMALAIKHNYFSPNIRLLVFTGLLGGFTTFSAFGVDTIYLLEKHEIVWAGLYVLLTVLAGITALWLGTLSVR